MTETSILTINDIKSKDKGDSITTFGKIINIVVNYDKKFIQTRCSVCYTELNKGDSCYDHKNDKKVSTISNIYFVLNDGSEDSINCYLTNDFWESRLVQEEICLGFCPSEIVNRTSIEEVNLDFQKYLYIIFDGFLMKDFEITGKIGVTQKMDDKIYSIRCESMKSIVPLVGDNIKKIAKLSKDLEKEAIQNV